MFDVIVNEESSKEAKLLYNIQEILLEKNKMRVKYTKERLSEMKRPELLKTLKEERSKDSSVCPKNYPYQENEDLIKWLSDIRY